MMGVRKYLFWESEEGVRTYKVSSKGSYDLMKPLGKECFTGGSWEKFFLWFHKTAAITGDEFIDFCFLSENELDFPELKYCLAAKSSWDKEEIVSFCEKQVCSDSFEIFYAPQSSFVHQIGNCTNPKNVKKLYLKCYPEFSMEIKVNEKNTPEETSVVNRYFMDMLAEYKKKNSNNEKKEN